MKHSLTNRFLRELDSFPLVVQRKFEKQLLYLLRDMRHPSLRVKKYDEARDIWQMRINGGVRCYFSIQGDEYVFLKIRKHTD